jgi:hypothetical protein
MHSATLSTGIILLSPLCKAAAMVEVARSTSMITTMLLLTSYRFNNAGDKQVKRVGFVFKNFSLK